MIKLDSAISRSPFFQQNLKHCIPNLNLAIIIFVYLIMAIISLIVGVICLRYEGRFLRVSQIHQNGQITEFTVDVSKTKKDLFIYYQVEGFKQNIRSYQTNFDLKQLKTKKPFTSFHFTPTCGRMDQFQTENQPCGILYSSRPNDEIQISVGGKPLPLEKSHINYKTYLHTNKVYGPTFKTLPEFEEAINWMQPSIENVKKLYAVIKKENLQNVTSLTVKITGDYFPSKINQKTYSRKYFVEEMTSFGSHDQINSMAIISSIVFVINLALVLTHLGLLFKTTKVYKQYASKQNPVNQSKLENYNTQTVEISSVYVRTQKAEGEDE